MKWVTRDFVHLDRVACPWLIKRFIDRDAQFVFVPWGSEHERPADAIAFAIPGCELGPHDSQGTTYDKLMAKYRLEDPSLVAIGAIIRAGVAWVLHGERPSDHDEYGHMAFGLLAISEGVMLIHSTDAEIVDASLGIYDALYANFRAHRLLQASGKTLPAPEGKGPTNATILLRRLLAVGGRT